MNQQGLGTIIQKANIYSDLNDYKKQSRNFQSLISEILSGNGILESFETKSHKLDSLIYINGIEKINEEFHIISIIKKILKDYEYLYSLYETNTINLYDILFIGIIEEKGIGFIKNSKHLVLLIDIVKKCKLPYIIENGNGIVSTNIETEILNEARTNYNCIKTMQVNGQYYYIFGQNINETIGKQSNIILSLDSITKEKQALKILFGEINKLFNIDRISLTRVILGEEIELSSIGDFTLGEKPNPIGETSKRVLNSKSILYKAIKNNEIIITNDMQTWANENFTKKGFEIPRFTSEIIKAGYKSVMIIPIIKKGIPIGLLFLNSLEKEGFQNVDCEKAQSILGTLIFGVSKILDIKSMLEVSLRDQLTQLYNRNYLESWINDYTMLQKKKFESGNHNGGVFIHMDLDHFKQINDTYGHDAGDEVLRQVSKTIVNTLRAQDITIRTGGEEILICLDGCDIKGGIAAMKRLQRAINMIKIQHKGNKIENISVSGGIVGFSNGCDRYHNFNIETAKNNIKLIIELTDKLLYVSKRDRKCYTRFDLIIDLPNPNGQTIQLSGGSEKLTNLLANNQNPFKLDQHLPISFSSLVIREKDEEDSFNKENNDTIFIFKKLTQLFPGIELDKIIQLSGKFIQKSYQDGEKIIESGKPLEKFIISSNGTIKIQYSNEADNMILDCGCLKYGECSRFITDLNGKSDYEYVAVGFSDVWEVDMKEITNLIK